MGSAYVNFSQIYFFYSETDRNLLLPRKSNSEISTGYERISQSEAEVR